MSEAAAKKNADNTLINELNQTAGKLNKAARGALVRISDSGQQILDELVKSGQRFKRESGNGDGWRTRLAGLLGLPTREEMHSLDKKLDRISRKVNKLAREQKA